MVMKMYNWGLSPWDIKRATKLAKKSVEYYDKRFGDGGSGNYQHNRLEGCLVGTKCEYGAFGWLRWKVKGKKITADFENLTSHTDVLCGEQKIEIKGLRNNQWDSFKRCIPPTQLDKYVAKNALVIWATTEANEEGTEVKLWGWNWASDVKDKGVFRKTICDNIWLKEDSDMRSLDSLISVLSENINSESQ